MGKLSFFTDPKSKKKAFNQSDTTYYKIDDAYQFVKWYEKMHKIAELKPLQHFFRGSNEARYKLYNSAQRYWIQNNLTELEKLSKPIPYIKMVQDMVNKAKENKLLEQVFEYYKLKPDQMDFPVLSILQHYAAPTPLMDWTYNLDVALFFSIDKVKRSEDNDSIENYISIYHIDNVLHRDFVINNLNDISANRFPSVSGLSKFLGNNKVVYISDFEISQLENQINQVSKEKTIIKPLTTYFNLNILAQKGIFIFNPHESRPLEEFAPVPKKGKKDTRIHCYHINKDLEELIKLKIGRNKIDASFIYPELRQFSRNVLSDYLQWMMNI